jgi:hypothetical protein
MAAFWVVVPCSLIEVYHVSEVFAASIIRAMLIMIALMVEAASTSETSANLYQTARCNNPGDSHLHARRRENLKSHSASILNLHLNLKNDKEVLCVLPTMCMKWSQNVKVVSVCHMSVHIFNLRSY